MLLNWDTTSVVLHADETILAIDFDLDFIHVLVSLLVVCRIDHDLVKDLVQTRHKADLSRLHRFCLRVEDPHLGLCPFH